MDDLRNNLDDAESHAEGEEGEIDENLRSASVGEDVRDVAQESSELQPSTPADPGERSAPLADDPGPASGSGMLSHSEEIQEHIQEADGAATRTMDKLLGTMTQATEPGGEPNQHKTDANHAEPPAPERRLSGAGGATEAEAPNSNETHVPKAEMMSAVQPLSYDARLGTAKTEPGAAESPTENPKPELNAEELKQLQAYQRILSLEPGRERKPDRELWKLQVCVEQAPVLLLWAAAVARTRGYDWYSALNLAEGVRLFHVMTPGARQQALDECNQFKVDPSVRAVGEVVFIEIMGIPVKTLKTAFVDHTTYRVVHLSRRVTAKKVDNFIKINFGDQLPMVYDTMMMCLEKWPSSTLNSGRSTYSAFHHFSPPATRGGAGMLKIAKILTVRDQLSYLTKVHRAPPEQSEPPGTTQTLNLPEAMLQLTGEAAAVDPAQSASSSLPPLSSLADHGPASSMTISGTYSAGPAEMSIQEGTTTNVGGAEEQHGARTSATIGQTDSSGGMNEQPAMQPGHITPTEPGQTGSATEGGINSQTNLATSVREDHPSVGLVPGGTGVDIAQRGDQAASEESKSSRRERSMRATRAAGLHQPVSDSRGPTTSKGLTSIGQGRSQTVPSFSTVHGLQESREPTASAGSRGRTDGQMGLQPMLDQQVSPEQPRDDLRPSSETKAEDTLATREELGKSPEGKSAEEPAREESKIELPTTERVEARQEPPDAPTIAQDSGRVEAGVESRSNSPEKRRRTPPLDGGSARRGAEMQGAPFEHKGGEREQAEVKREPLTRLSDGDVEVRQRQQNTPRGSGRASNAGSSLTLAVEDKTGGAESSGASGPLLFSEGGMRISRRSRPAAARGEPKGSLNLKIENDLASSSIPKKPVENISGASHKDESGRNSKETGLGKGTSANNSRGSNPEISDEAKRAVRVMHARGPVSPARLSGAPTATEASRTASKIQQIAQDSSAELSHKETENKSRSLSPSRLSSKANSVETAPGRVQMRKLPESPLSDGRTVALRRQAVSDSEGVGVAERLSSVVWKENSSNPARKPRRGMDHIDVQLPREPGQRKLYKSDVVNLKVQAKRSAVLILWGAAVAMERGFDWNSSLSLALAAGYFHGQTLIATSLANPFSVLSDPDKQERDGEAGLGYKEVHIVGARIKARTFLTQDANNYKNLRAIDLETDDVLPAVAYKILLEAFGKDLSTTYSAMRMLASAMPESLLEDEKSTYDAYLLFRPDVASESVREGFAPWLRSEYLARLRDHFLDGGRSTEGIDFPSTRPGFPPLAGYEVAEEEQGLFESPTIRLVSTAVLKLNVRASRLAMTVLWGAVVAKKMGFDWTSSMSLGFGCATWLGLEKRSGRFKPKKAKKEGYTFSVLELLGVRILTLMLDGEGKKGFAVFSEGSIISARYVKVYLTNHFGDNLPYVFNAMHQLAASMPMKAIKSGEAAYYAYILFCREGLEPQDNSRGQIVPSTINLEVMDDLRKAYEAGIDRPYLRMRSHEATESSAGSLRKRGFDSEESNSSRILERRSSDISGAVSMTGSVGGEESAGGIDTGRHSAGGWRSEQSEIDSPGRRSAGGWESEGNDRPDRREGRYRKRPRIT
ncbi:hypothetical protein NDN08_003872 [Rhodosorus marinus]|uniref:Uncharacterized protein n=1 Tax=Rhodosorus marinus TaxID=101924 RepID=A0AAV8UJM2_9RHOD|nr:hypothetical protein NDN08_003872 [Rhodosorus marinus]